MGALTESTILLIFGLDREMIAFLQHCMPLNLIHLVDLL